MSGQGPILGAGVCAVAVPASLVVGTWTVHSSQLIPLLREAASIIQKLWKMHQLVGQLPQPGPSHLMKKLRVQSLHFALVDLFIERGLESELLGVEVQGRSFLLGSGLEHAEQTLPGDGMGRISSSSTPFLPWGREDFFQGRHSSL